MLGVGRISAGSGVGLSALSALRDGTAAIPHANPRFQFKRALFSFPKIALDYRHRRNLDSSDFCHKKRLNCYMLCVLCGKKNAVSAVKVNK